MWANSAAIAAHKLINLSTSLQQQQNMLLLLGNNREFSAAFSDHKSAFNFRATYEVIESNGVRSFGDTYSPGTRPVNVDPVETSVSRISAADHVEWVQKKEADTKAISAITGDPDSCAKLNNCIGPSATVAENSPSISVRNAETVADETGVLAERNASLQKINGILESGDSFVNFAAGLTAAVGIYDLLEWTINSDLETKAADVGNVYNLAD